MSFIRREGNIIFVDPSLFKPAEREAPQPPEITFELVSPATRVGQGLVGILRSNLDYNGRTGADYALCAAVSLAEYLVVDQIGGSPVFGYPDTQLLALARLQERLDEIEATPQIPYPVSMLNNRTNFYQHLQLQLQMVATKRESLRYSYRPQSDFRKIGNLTQEIFGAVFSPIAHRLGHQEFFHADAKKYTRYMFDLYPERLYHQDYYLMTTKMQGWQSTMRT